MMDQAADTPDFAACLTRARALMDRSRYADAAGWLRQAIQIEPDAFVSYSLLSICLMNVERQERAAEETARRAVSLEPEDSFARAIHSLALAHLAKDGQDRLVREALEEAQEAVRLDPDSDFAHATLGRAWLRLSKWPEAEAAARQALALDPEDPGAAEVLSAALLRQGKQEDHDHLVRYQLQKNPEDDSTHATAGWNALRKGDHKGANKHFTEALRLNPMSEGARLGLVESYRARSVVYSSLIRFDAFMDRLTAGRQTAFWIGGYVAYRMLYGTLKTSAPWAASLLAGTWLLLIFWTSLGRGLASFTMLFDRFARQSLTARERWEGLIVGGMAVLALVFLGISFAEGSAFALVALSCFFGALPAASAFTNDHYIGKYLYWAVAAFCLGSALYVLAAIGAGILLGIALPGMKSVMVAGIWTAVIFSFVRAFGIGYR